MKRAKKHWKRVPSPVRKPLVFVLGAGIMVIGLALIPLPGPGWLIVFLGLAILASEFAFAERIRDWIVSRLQVYLQRFRNWLKRVWKKKK